MQQGSAITPRRAPWMLGLLAALALAGLVFAGVHAQAKRASGSLTTLFDSNNGNAGVSFDLAVLPRGGVDVKRFDLNLENAGDTGPVQVWTRPGTAVGFEGDSSGWTLRGTFQVTSQGTDNRTPVPISFHLERGNYGFVVGASGPDPDVGTEYTNGSDTFENDVLRLTTGVGFSSPLFEGGTTSGGRIFNGTIYYRVPCVSAKKKVKKAKKAVKKAKQKLANAVDSGDAEAIAKAEQKLENKQKNLKQAKRKKKKACR